MMSSSMQAFHRVGSRVGEILQIIARPAFGCAALYPSHLHRSMGPLSDIKVLELGTLIAGPFCSRILAEFGAQVIKIESPDGGDPLRQWRKLHDGTSLWWYLQARNKKSVTVNMREPEGQEIVRQLAAGADIVIENFRPGALEKWGLGWDEAVAIEPGTGHGAAVGLWSDRSVPRARGLRRDRRGDGRPALCHRATRTAHRCASASASGMPSRRSTA